MVTIRRLDNSPAISLPPYGADKEKSPLKTIGVLGASALAAPLLYSFIEPYRVVVKRFEAPMENLPASADGLRIAQISDLHASAITSSAIIDTAVKLCNDESPDMVVLTGDLVSRRNSYLPLSFVRLWAKPVMFYAAQMARSIAALRAPLGIFAVPGNHDYSEGSFDPIDKLLIEAGVTSLINKNARAGELPVIGVDDLRVGRPTVRAACTGIAAEEAQIVLSHNPRILPLFAHRNALVLAGHTHSGQVHLPLVSFRRTPGDMADSPWQGGWYSDDRARLYVSAGLGSVHFPMRFRCPPEIVIFTLRKA